MAKRALRFLRAPAQRIQKAIGELARDQRKGHPRGCPFYAAAVLSFGKGGAQGVCLFALFGEDGFVPELF